MKDIKQNQEDFQELYKLIETLLNNNKTQEIITIINICKEELIDMQEEETGNTLLHLALNRDVVNLSVLNSIEEKAGIKYQKLIDTKNNENKKPGHFMIENPSESVENPEVNISTQILRQCQH